MSLSYLARNWPKREGLLKTTWNEALDLLLLKKITHSRFSSQLAGHIFNRNTKKKLRTVFSDVEINSSKINDKSLEASLEALQYPGEGNGNPLQYSCLENPMDGGAC